MDLQKELDKASKEIFRFEALQEYFSDGSNERENETMQQWREKGEIDMNLMKHWHGFIKKKTKTGVKMTWVRLVEFPLTEYTKKALWIYERRGEYGIEIRIITKNVFDKLGVGLKDFYLIDNKDVLQMNYGKSNEYLGCELNNRELEKHKKYHKLLVENSVSVDNFKY